MRTLEGRRILVTGATRGAGLTLVRQLVPLGPQLMLCSRNALELKRLASQLDEIAPTRALALDVTDEDGTTEALDWCCDVLGLPDLVVHAVSAGTPPAIAGLAQDGFEEAIRRTLSGTLNVIRAAATSGITRIAVLVPGAGEAGAPFLPAALQALVAECAGHWSAEGVRIAAIPAGDPLPGIWTLLDA